MLRRQIEAAGELYPRGDTSHAILLDPFVAPSDEKFEPVRNLQKGFQAVAKDIVNAVVFSSIATGDIVPYWSDVDIMVVVKDEAIMDVGRFRSLRERVLKLEDQLYQFDPWQHHGIQYITETDMRFYPESFLPMATMEKGKSLLAASSLIFHVRDSKEEQVRYFYGLEKLMTQAVKQGELRHHDKDKSFLKNDFAGAEDNFYQFKYFVSVVLLLPSLYIALVDKPIYKRESFERIQDYFSEEELELVRACEKVRRLFTHVQPRGNEIPQEVIPVLGNHYFERAQTLLATMIAAYERRESAKAA